MANISGSPRVGWVHPKNAPGTDAKTATMEAGAGNVTAEPPAGRDFLNPKPTIASESYPTPKDSGGMADGETGGNYMATKIPDLQVVEADEG